MPAVFQTLLLCLLGLGHDRSLTTVQLFRV